MDSGARLQDILEQVLEPIETCSQDRTLGQVLGILNQGKPILLHAGTWFLILPEAAVGYPTSRRVIDLPCSDAPVFGPDLSVGEVATTLSQQGRPYGLVVHGEQLLGLVSEKRLQEYLNTTARKQAEEEVEARQLEVEIVADLAKTISASLDSATVLHRIGEAAIQLCNGDISAIALEDPESHDMVIRYSVGTRRQGRRSIRISPGRGLGGQVLLTGLPARTAHYAKDPLLSRDYLKLVRAEGIHAGIAVPIRIGEHMAGILYVAKRRACAFTDRDEQILCRLAHHAAMAIYNARLFEQICAGRERLQLVSRRLLRVPEEERRHLARELHDEIGQLLTALSLILQRAMRVPALETKKILHDAQAMVTDLLTRTHDLSLDLRPSMLDDLGLLPGLQWLLQKYCIRTRVLVTLEHAGLESRFPADVETGAYRIVQEGLTNIARHAGVHKATVRVWAEAGKLSLHIEDRGKGFDVEAAMAVGANSGLAGMHERALLAGGTLQLFSQPGVGTVVSAEFPLQRTKPSTEDEKTLMRTADGMEGRFANRPTPPSALSPHDCPERGWVPMTPCASNAAISSPERPRSSPST